MFHGFRIPNVHCSSVSVLHCNISRNRLPGVVSYTAAITGPETLDLVISEAEPRVVSHTATASATVDYTKHSVY